MKKLVNVNPGEVYAIPLFVSDQDDTRRFSRKEFDRKAGGFGFCRIIKDLAGSGIIIEVFNFTGDQDASQATIVESGRLFPPIAITGLGIYKQRWRKLYTDENFDAEKNAAFSQIALVLGTEDDLRLWRNGVKSPISRKAAEQYERWKLWSSSQVEKRILAILNIN